MNIAAPNVDSSCDCCTRRTQAERELARLHDEAEEMRRGLEHLRDSIAEATTVIRETAAACPRSGEAPHERE